MLNKLAVKGGWLGMFLIHGATMPVTIRIMLGEAENVPPMDQIMLLAGGLLLFLFRAVAQKDWLYIVSNAIGCSAQLLLAFLILFWR